MAIQNPIPGDLTEAQVMETLADLEASPPFADTEEGAKAHYAIRRISYSCDALDIWTDDLRSRVKAMTARVLLEVFGVGVA